MLAKRVIGVISILNGVAVQSISYSKYLPLGKPQFFVENLNRWGVDEILIQVIDRSRNNLGPDFNLIEKIGAMGINTPLIYAGGIRSVEDCIRLIKAGADRIAVDSILFNNPQEITNISSAIGAQALIASLPLSFVNGRTNHYNYIKSAYSEISPQIISIIESGLVSETLVIDWNNEGYDEFDIRLVNTFPIKNISLIAFGGIKNLGIAGSLLKEKGVVAICVGNYLNFKEHAYQSIKTGLSCSSLRPALYACNSPIKK